MMRRLLWVLVAGLVLVPAGSAIGPASAPTSRVIVVLDRATPEPGAVAAEHAKAFGAQPFAVYRSALRGYAAMVPDARLAALRRDPRVAYVERDQRVEAFAQSTPTGVKRVFAESNTSLDIDGTDDVRVDVDVAVIDTGIDFDHPDLNVVARTNCTGGGPFKQSCANDSGDDGNGHGTHVAGSIAALDNGAGVVGVAPGARLHAVKVLGDNGSGWTSWIIAGIDWVTARANVIEVANMSLGCECSSAAQDEAIAKSVAAGVVYAVAAGNSDKDAATFSPANHADVITVSALADFDGLAGAAAASTCRSDQDDTLADFSNWGTEVEVAAPGVCITSTWMGGGYNTISGTSMASPHVAGAAAILASGSGDPRSKKDVDAIRDTIVAKGNNGWTDDSGDSIREPLLDVRDAAFTAATVSGGGGDTNATPTASFTYSCTELSCSFNGSGSSDSDGSIASYSWVFGDGSSESGATVSHTYAAGGAYEVTLTVTDDDGATGAQTQTVTVSAAPGGFTLSVSGYKVKGVQHADLTWSGATATSVDVYRDGSKLTTTANDGTYTDTINRKGGGSYTYKVCEAGTSTCSNEATVVF